MLSSLQDYLLRYARRVAQCAAIPSLQGEGLGVGSVISVILWLRRSSCEEAAAKKRQRRSSCEEAAAKKQLRRSSSEEAAAKKRQRRSGSEEAAAKKRQRRSGSEEAAAKKQQRRSSSEEAAAKKILTPPLPLPYKGGECLTESLPRMTAQHSPPFKGRG
ncbi:MAG: hypothetical protein K6B13_01495 [Prevotella sp.]|nr:hypothetical protein [Prevotella sp.]